MADRPLDIPTWATDENYVAVGEAWDGQPTKVAPAPAKQAEGVEPAERFPADHFNWLLNRMGGWAAYLAAVPLVNWDVRAHATTSTPTACAGIAGRTWTGELDSLMAIFDSAGNGLAQRSTDGIHWTDLSGGITGALRDVVFMAGAVNLWLLAGDTGTIWSHATNTGGSWTARGPASGDHFNAIAVNDDSTLAVAVGENGRIYTSTNGTAWTSRTSGTAEDLKDVAYGNGRWVAVGTNNKIITSTDGTTWSSLLGSAGSTVTHAVYDANADRVLCFLAASVRHVTPATGVLSAAIGAVGGTVSAVATDGAGTVLALCANARLYWTTDGGETWSSGSPVPQGAGVSSVFNGMCFYPDHGCYFIAAETGTAPLLMQSERTA